MVARARSAPWIQCFTTLSFWIKHKEFLSSKRPVRYKSLFSGLRKKGAMKRRREATKPRSRWKRWKKRNFIYLSAVHLDGPTAKNVFFCTSNPKQPCVANPDMLLSYTDKPQVPFLTLSLQKYHHQPSFHHLGVVCTALRWRLWGWPIPANTTFANNSHTPWWS